MFSESVFQISFSDLYLTACSSVLGSFFSFFTSIDAFDYPADVWLTQHVPNDMIMRPTLAIREDSSSMGCVFKRDGTG